MHKQRSELKAGIFVIACLATATGVLLWLGAADLALRPHSQVAFYVGQDEGSVGLVTGSEVVVAGKPVGRIVAVKLQVDRNRALYVARIEQPGVELRADGAARVVCGLLGNNVLAITDFGSQSAPPADESNPVHVTGGLEQAMGNLAVATENIRQLTDFARRELDAARAGASAAKVHAVLDQLHESAASAARLTAILCRQADPTIDGSLLAKIHAGADDLGQTAAAIRHQTDTGQSDSVLAKMHDVVDDVRAVTADARPRIQQTLAAVQSTAEQVQAYTKQDLAELLATMRRTSDKVLAIATNFEEVSKQGKELLAVNREQVDEILYNLNLVTADLRATSADVRRSPWKLLYQPPASQVHSQNIYDAARAFSNGAEQLDQAMLRLATLARAKGQLAAADDPELARIRAQVKDSFENFVKVEQALWRELAR